MEVFGNIILRKENDLPINTLKRIIERPFIKPRYRISVLTQDEQVSYIIPEDDIVAGGLNFTESYQNGQRKNISVELVNTSGRYTPSVTGLWVNTRFSFDIGLEYNGRVIWFPKGIYVMGNITLSRGDSNKTV